MSMFLATSFPIDTGVDLDFRPASYVADWCATAAVVQNIVGEERRARDGERRGARTSPRGAAHREHPQARRHAHGSRHARRGERLVEARERAGHRVARAGFQRAGDTAGHGHGGSV